MSRLAPLLRPTTLPSPSTIASRSMPLASRHRRRIDQKDHRPIQNTSCRGDSRSGAAVSGRRANRSFEDIFINSLATAATCRQHRRDYSLLDNAGVRPHFRQERRPIHRTEKRWLSSQVPRKNKASAAAELPALPEISRGEYKELVNTYPDFDEKKAMSKRGKREHLPLAPRLVLTPLEELSATKGQRKVLPPEDDQHAAELERFTSLLRRPLGRISHDRLWDLYQDLRAPRPRYLKDSSFSRFFRHLSWVMFKDSEITMQRYFALLDECIGEGVYLSKEAWNGAITFAGRWLRNATSNEVKVAIETWMRMEKAGHEADHVTFNILFGVAVRAGRYALADTILAELQARDLPLNRYFRASMIHYAGVKRDGDGVRQAFRDLVNTGEIVDTAVMNCVILSLIRAGEPAAAENVFFRMKALHEQKFGVAALQEWQRRRQLAKILNTTGERLRQEKEQHESSFFGAAFSADDRREEVQKATPIAPDSTTYALLIKHHAYTSGDLNKIRELLEEMTQNKHHIHGSVYVHILRGFWIHGGYAFSAWSRKALEDFWVEILAASVPSFAAPETVYPAETPEPNTEEDRSDLLGAMLFDEEQRRASQPEEEVPYEEPDDWEPIAELERPTYFAKGLAMASVHAFYKCTGSKRMLEVWDEILARWKDAPDNERERVQEAVDRMLRQDSIYIH